MIIFLQDIIKTKISFQIILILQLITVKLWLLWGTMRFWKIYFLKAILGTIPLEENCEKFFINNKDVTDKGLSIINHKVGYVP